MATGATLEQLIINGDGATAYCASLKAGAGRPVCSHGATLDLLAIAARLGRRDVGLYDRELQRRLRCKRCGGRGASFIVSPPPASVTAAGRRGLRR